MKPFLITLFIIKPMVILKYIVGDLLGAKETYTYIYVHIYIYIFLTIKIQ